MTTSSVLGLFRTRDRTRAEFFAHLARRAAGGLTWISACATGSCSSPAPAAVPDRPLARAFADEGAFVALQHRDGRGVPAGREEAAADIVAAGGRAIAVSADLDSTETGRGDGRARRSRARARSASWSRRRPPTRRERFAEINDESWASVVDDLLGATFRACRAVVPGMQEAGWGRIVNIAARSGLVGRRPVHALRRGEGRDRRPDRVARQGARAAGDPRQRGRADQILTDQGRRAVDPRRARRRDGEDDPASGGSPRRTTSPDSSCGSGSGANTYVSGETISLTGGDQR